MAKKKIVAYKLALKQLRSYEKNVAAGKELKSSVMEKFKADITPFLNKNGTISKRAIRYQKNIDKFNRIVSDFKKNPRKTATNRKNIIKKATATAINNGTVKDKKHYENAIKLFSNNVIQALLDVGALESDDVVEWAEDEEKIENYLKLADYLKIQIEGVPDELKKYHSEDDINIAISEFSQMTSDGVDIDTALQIMDNNLQEVFFSYTESGMTADEAVDLMREKYEDRLR